MKEILIINRGTKTDNFGDEAINFCLQKLLSDQNSSVECVNYTLFFERDEGKLRSLLNNLKRAVNLIKNNYDLIIFGGGQLIQSNRRFPLSFFIWTVIIKLFSKSKIKTFGIGVDEKYTFTKKILFKLAFRGVEEFYVRDELSQINLKSVFGKKAYVTPDVVFTISDFYLPNKREEQPTLFGITTFKSIKRYKYIEKNELEYLDHQAHLLLSYYDDGVKLIYNTKDDFKYALKLQAYVKNKYDKDIVIIEINDMYEYIDIINSARIVVSSRMHALIISLSYGIHIKPYIRNEKLEGFKKFINHFDKEDYKENVIKGVKKIIL